MDCSQSNWKWFRQTVNPDNKIKTVLINQKKTNDLNGHHIW